MKAKFTGHDTFSLRYGWLYKSVNYLFNNGKLQTSNEAATRDAIVQLGVGKNMVNAIRYWSESTGIVKAEIKKSVINHEVSKKSYVVFGDGERVGNDPFMEKIGTVWLIHFWLNFNQKYLTSYRYFFNYSTVQHFEKTKLINDLALESKRLIWGEDKTSTTTFKKDIDCFLGTYARKRKITGKRVKSIDEDHFNSPLAELDLLKDNGGGFYLSDLTNRPSLPIHIFVYALLEFFQMESEGSGVNTIDFDSLLNRPLSPGRIFRLSESGLGEKLDEAQAFTNGKICWIDSLGLRQVRIDDSIRQDQEAMLEQYYG